jgi:hypothetical protein
MTAVIRLRRALIRPTIGNVRSSSIDNILEHFCSDYELVKKIDTLTLLLKYPKYRALMFQQNPHLLRSNRMHQPLIQL